jgi:hypothetical protein
MEKRYGKFGPYRTPPHTYYIYILKSIANMVCKGGGIGAFSPFHNFIITKTYQPLNMYKKPSRMSLSCFTIVDSRPWTVGFLIPVPSTISDIF